MCRVREHSLSLFQELRYLSEIYSILIENNFTYSKLCRWWKPVWISTVIWPSPSPNNTYSNFSQLNGALYFEIYPTNLGMKHQLRAQTCRMLSLLDVPGFRRHNAALVAWEVYWWDEYPLKEQFEFSSMNESFHPFF